MAKESGADGVVGTLKEEGGETERVKEMLSKASINGFSVRLNTGGTLRIHGGEISNVVVGGCWIFFTHGVKQLRTETYADKEKLLRGNLEAVTCRRVNLPPERQEPEITSKPSKSCFVPRSGRSRLIGATI